MKNVLLRDAMGSLKPTFDGWRSFHTFAILWSEIRHTFTLIEPSRIKMSFNFYDV